MMFVKGRNRNYGNRKETKNARIEAGLTQEKAAERKSMFPARLFPIGKMKNRIQILSVSLHLVIYIP